MSDTTETETIEATVEYYLHVSLDGTSGEQEWGPFATREQSNQVAVAAATRSNVNKIRTERRVTV